jgi:N-methylhydantoinase B
MELEYFAAPFVEEGGSGAVKGYDGWSGAGSIPVPGVIYRGSIEICELRLPTLWKVAELAQDLEGAGEFTGARGFIGKRVDTAPPGARTMLMSGNCSGQLFGGAGQAGAPRAPTSDFYIHRTGEEEKEVFRTFDMTELHAGDILVTKAGGGGGWGNPLDRDVEKVRKDVRDEFISLRRARNVYGVVINADTLEADHQATEKLRKELRNSPLYRHADLVLEDARNGKISLQEARDVYGVILKKDKGRLVVDQIETDNLRPK